MKLLLLVLFFTPTTFAQTQNACFRGAENFLQSKSELHYSIDELWQEFVGDAINIYACGDLCVAEMENNILKVTNKWNIQAPAIKKRSNLLLAVDVKKQSLTGKTYIDTMRFELNKNNLAYTSLYMDGLKTVWGFRLSQVKQGTCISVNSSFGQYFSEQAILKARQ